MVKSLILVLLAGSQLVPLSGPAPLAAEMNGYSIVARLSEVVHSRRQGTFDLDWTAKIYVSNKGRIFAQHDLKSSDSDRNNNHMMAPEDQGQRSSTSFRWSGANLTRSWTGRNGNHVTQTILITPSANGYSCRMLIERSRGRASVVSQSCQVTKGNVLAGAT